MRFSIMFCKSWERRKQFEFVGRNENCEKQNATCCLHHIARLTGSAKIVLMSDATVYYDLIPYLTAAGKVDDVGVVVSKFETCRV